MKAQMNLRRLLAPLLAGLLLLSLAPGIAALQGQPAGTVASAVVNVRSGPGTNYAIIAQATQGAVYDLTGRNQAGDWLQVCCINNGVGWIFSSLLTVEGSTAGLPVITVAPPAPQPTPPPQNFTGWRGEYYANRDLQGSPAFVRDDPNINFRWAGASPGNGVRGTNFSVRWTRSLNFTAGNYTFYAQVDDGVRLWIDTTLLIDNWQQGSQRTLSNTLNRLGAGQHTIRVEYFQAEGDSTAVVWWEQVGQFPEWKGEYFNDIYLQGTPLLVRNDLDINFNWGLGSPDPAVPADNFSVRWTRRVQFDAGDWAFFARTSDGVRIYVDGWLVVDEWRDTVGYPTYTGIFRGLGQGEHTVVVEYYERGGIAYADVWWQKQFTGGGNIP